MESAQGDGISQDDAVKDAELIVNGGDKTALIVNTSPDGAGNDVTSPANPAYVTLDVTANSTTEDNMGNDSSKPAVSITQIKPLSPNGELKPAEYTPGQKKDLDDVFPATSLTTSTVDGKVKLRMSNSGRPANKPITVQTMFRQTVERSPNAMALAVKRDGKWQNHTYQQFYDLTVQVAKAFIKVGLEPYHGMGILGFNSPEWFISYFGAIFAGGKATGIYATNSSEACCYVLADCEANVIVVENHMQLKKILKGWEKLPHLKAIVQYTGEVAERREGIYSWEEFIKLGDSVTDAQLQDRYMLQAPNTCASLIYTSGTTGNPKAVMISHDNLTWTGRCACERLKIVVEVMVSFLPLSHIAAQMVDIIIPLSSGSAIYFAQPDALKGTLGDTWKEIRPTLVLAVPRVWEKIQEKMVAAGSQSSKLKKRLVAWARDKGLRGVHAENERQSKPWGWNIANFLIFKKVRGILGLDRCRLFGSAAAPIMKDTLEFFASLNIRIDEAYGMSESSGPHTFCGDDGYRMTSIGKEMYGVETRLDQPDKDGNGEILIWGRHVFMGYLKEPEKTAEAIDEQGWLHSGDIGKRDDQNFLYITGRIKEIIITAGGENVAPVPIEDRVKEAVPGISNCMLIGDKKKFLSMLVALKTDVNIDTMEPLNTLTPECKQWCKTHGSDAQTVAEAMSDKDILKAIQTGIDVANGKAVSRASKVQKWSILPQDFSLPGGELGPTLKLRRPIVVKQYEKTIAAFYED